jgi:LPXTG-motif cell wall-anchored protein
VPPPPSTSTVPPPPTTTEPPDPTPTCVPRPSGNHVSPNPDYCSPNTGADLGNVPWIMGGLAALGIVGLMLTRKRTLG